MDKIKLKLDKPYYIGSVQRLYNVPDHPDFLISETTAGGSVFDVGTIFNIEGSDIGRASFRHLVFQELQNPEAWNDLSKSISKVGSLIQRDDSGLVEKVLSDLNEEEPFYVVHSQLKADENEVEKIEVIDSQKRLNKLLEELEKEPTDLNSSELNKRYKSRVDKEYDRIIEGLVGVMFSIRPSFASKIIDDNKEIFVSKRGLKKLEEGVAIIYATADKEIKRAIIGEADFKYLGSFTPNSIVEEHRGNLAFSEDELRDYVGDSSKVDVYQIRNQVKYPREIKLAEVGINPPMVGTYLKEEDLEKIKQASAPE